MYLVKKPINPKAVNKDDQFIIARREGKSWRAIESWQAKFIAEHWMKALKLHEPKARFRIIATAEISYI
jgi:hypothetical protein